MAHEWQTELGGESVLLLGARALYRPASQALLIADLHLGKGDAFRRAGIGLPRGGTLHDLERLDALLARYRSVDEGDPRARRVHLGLVASPVVLDPPSEV